MTQSTISNSQAGSSVRSALNTMFGELYNVKANYIPAQWFGFMTSVTGGAASGTGTIRFLPFAITKTITISDLGTRVTTLSASGLFGLAIYANNATTNRPTGTALASVNGLSTSSATSVSGTLGANVQLVPGIYWMAANCDNATAAFQTVSGSTGQAAVLVGGSTLAIANPASSSIYFHLLFSQTYGTWPDMTSNVCTETSGNNTCMIWVKVASVP